MSGPKVVTAVRRELRELREADPDVGRSVDAAAALALARRIDDPGTPASALDRLARELAGVLRRLRERSAETGAAAPQGPVDELAERAAAKLRRAS